MADPFTNPQFGVDSSGNLTAFSQNQSTQTKSVTLRYPYKKIEASDDYLKIDVIKYTPPGLGTQEGSFALNTSDQTYEDQLGSPNSKKDILRTILLPIPENIQDNNSAAWGQSSFNPLEAALGSMGGDALTSKNFFNSLVGNLISEAGKVGSAAQTALGQKALQTAFVSSAIKAALGKGGNLNESISRFNGAVFNDNVEMIFNGVTIRPEFSFTFDMVPRDEKESREIKEIIKSFKQYSAVKKGLDSGNAEGLFLKSPEVFRLQYMSGTKPHPYLNRFKICALRGMSVNYTGSGTYATYSDGTPVYMQLTLSFQELTPIYAEDYTTQGGQYGVGY
jgi:hypothetical protein